MDEGGADTDYKHHFAGLVLDTLDSLALVWMRGHWLANSLFSAVVEKAPEFGEDIGCSYRFVVQEWDNLDWQWKLSYLPSHSAAVLEHSMLTAAGHTVLPEHCRYRSSPHRQGRSRRLILTGTYSTQLSGEEGGYIHQ